MRLSGAKELAENEYPLYPLVPKGGEQNNPNTLTPKMLKSIFIVGIGSFIGGTIRYIISTLMKSPSNTFLPWGTLTVNLLGCFLIGIIYALFAKHTNTASPLFLLLTTGFCGGFTTFSTFANEGLQMLQNGNIGGFITYILLSLIAGLALVALGYWIIK